MKIARTRLMLPRADKVSRAAQNRPHRQSPYMVGAKPALRMPRVFKSVGHAIAGAVKACLRWSLRRKLAHIQHRRQTMELQRAHDRLAEMVAEEMEAEILLALRGLDHPPVAMNDPAFREWTCRKLFKSAERPSKSNG